MDAEILHLNETGLWSLISGSRVLFDSTYSKTSVSLLSLNENRFRWTVTDGVCPVSYDTVMIIVHDLVVPTLITPNMDGRNDFFVLRGFKNLVKTELVIFNRIGVQVYKNLDHDNNWNGVDFNGNPLPIDTYFYVLRTDKGKCISGYLVIAR
jgi:gliding motility-associated-like protein